MKLSEEQQAFTKDVAKLILWADSIGDKLTFGEAWRTPEQAALNAKKGTGISNSLHCDRLAIDLLLFVDGVYQSGSESYRHLGTYWKTLHPLNRWGGDFKDALGSAKPDGNHFSREYNGRK